VDDAFVLAGEALELARDLLELPGPVLVDQDQQEVAQQLVASREQVLERGPLRARVELRVSQEPAQLGDLGLGGGKLLELLADRLEPAVRDGGLEQGARVDAVGDAQF
jgi:hypothetical protein